MSVCVWHFPLSGDTWIRVYLTFCLRHLSCSICKTIFAYKLQQQPAWSLTYSTQVERPARIYSIKIQRQGGKVRESKGKRGKHAWQCMTKVMNYLSPSPTAHNRTYGPRFQSGCSCGLHKSLPFPQKKRKMEKNGKLGKGKNTKKVVPLGDEMWICVHLFARFEMSDKRLPFNATASFAFFGGNDWESAVHLHFQIRDHDQDELVAVYSQSHAIHAVNQWKVSSVHLLCITRRANSMQNY